MVVVVQHTGFERSTLREVEGVEWLVGCFGAKDDKRVGLEDAKPRLPRREHLGLDALPQRAHVYALDVQQRRRHFSSHPNRQKKSETKVTIKSSTDLLDDRETDR